MSSPGTTATARAIALAIGGALLMSLPLSSSAASAAADEAPGSPVEFTATWDGANEIRFGGSRTVDGVTHHEGSAWLTVPVSEATDPRLRGTISIAANIDSYEASGGPAIVSHAFRIENTEGAWQQLPTTSIDFGDDEVSTSVGVLIGEGDYDGLIAVFEHQTDDDGWHLRGYIIEGRLPPPPEPFTAD